MWCSLKFPFHCSPICWVGNDGSRVDQVGVKQDSALAAVQLGDLYGVPHGVGPEEETGNVVDGDAFRTLQLWRGRQASGERCEHRTKLLQQQTDDSDQMSWVQYVLVGSETLKVQPGTFVKGQTAVACLINGFMCCLVMFS